MDHETLLVILRATDWKQAKGLLIWSSLNKLWYIQPVEYLFCVVKALKKSNRFSCKDIEWCSQCIK